MLYLAACLRHPLIDRIQDSRRYYNEIISAPNPDEWTHYARIALAETFILEDESKAEQLMRAYAAEAKDAKKIDDIQEWLSRHDFKSPSESPGAEDQMMVILQKAEDTLKTSRKWPTVNFIPFRDLPDAIVRINQLLPTYMERYPDLVPYLTASALVEQKSTNSPVVQAFVKSLENCRKDTNNLPDVVDYCRRYLEPAFYWAMRYNVYGLAVNIHDFRQLYSPGQPIDGEVYQIELARAFVGVERWQEALKIYEGFGERFIPVGRTNPRYYDEFEPLFSTALEARKCQEKLGLPLMATHHASLERAWFSSTYQCMLTFCENIPWVVSGDILMQLDENAQITRQFTLPKKPRTRLSAMCSTANRIWIGTDGDGLIEFDTQTGISRSWSSTNGLVMDSVASLYPHQDTLWIGYGTRSMSESSGGLGKMDLSSHQIVDMVPALPGKLRDNVLAMSEVAQMDAPDGPPRHTVACIGVVSADELWIGVYRKGLQRYLPAQRTWKWLPDFGEGYPTAIDINTNWTMVAAYGAISPKALIWRSTTATNWQSLSLENGLPHVNVLGAMLDGDYIWMGGRGFLTVMDARNGKILQSSLFKVRGILLVHERFGSLQVARNNVWFTANNNIYRVPKPY